VKESEGHKTRTALADKKLLLVNGQRIWIKGVSYGSFRENSDGERFPDPGRVRDDFSMMAESGVNLVRLYDSPSERIADLAAEAGLNLMVDVCWGLRGGELEDPAVLRKAIMMARGHVRRLAGHPAMLLYSLGNEIPALTVRWYGRRPVARFLRELYDTVKEVSPEALVTYVNYPPTEHLVPLLDFLDVVSFNLYLEDSEAFRKYLSRLQLLAGERPLMLAELGLDSLRNGEQGQAAFFREYLPILYDRGLCGAVLYSWTDEWAVNNLPIEDWAFGLTRGDRSPKPALEAVRDSFKALPGFLPGENVPKASVVICTYNGSATLHECLDSLTRLVYPDYEVIVVDDGSRDSTPEIVSGFPVRYIRLEKNGGLSRARNIGMKEATGEIIAYIDDDATADPHWLYFLAASLKRTAVAVGGPNYAHPADGFIAECVDESPGNPMHVLLNDELAEHVPGCNMAYKKQALESIGGFDPTHLVAGDDVDVCWKLLIREQRIVYSPSAIVWHHRRPTVRRFLRQQKNYGFAEGHLVDRHPGRFNMLGHGVWQGRIYGADTGTWLSERLSLFFPPKIYQGRFAGARFQTVYHPFTDSWLGFATIFEWQLLVLSLLAGGLIGILNRNPSGLALLLLGIACGSLTLLVVGLAGLRAVRLKKWQGKRRFAGFFIVAFLHLAQPVVRGFGRIKAWRHLRGRESRFSDKGYVAGGQEDREPWLELMNRNFRTCGWISRFSDDWEDADLHILGPGPACADFRTTYEFGSQAGQQFLRFSVKPRLKWWAWGLTGAVTALILASFLRPHTAPLALPLALFLRSLFWSRGHMSAVVSHIAVECAEALGMKEVR
jgi:glycosyltransferase involved in cell wall biosynthesis